MKSAVTYFKTLSLIQVQIEYRNKITKMYLYNKVTEHRGWVFNTTDLY
jgi:hypothetical protein